ncbi:MAG: ABC transporter permease [Coriobacteriales bacterium]|jgi:teichoic acid transport system permease protein|nr:ABC transporter permease [Coriobacteriales bacterium]
MFNTLKAIIVENFQWSGQARRLAVFELQKTVRGAVLGWFWLFIKPIMFIGTFWFVLELGLRANRTVGDSPFLLWLACGLIPWFYISDMLSAGSNVYNRYSYLIDRMNFPASVIPTFFSLSRFIIFVISLVIAIIVMLICGFPLTLYALQVPFIALAMFIFFILFSLMTSPLSAISKDFKNLIRALSMPIFWLSGVIFNFAAIDIPWIKWLFIFNPVSFLVTSFRAALCDHYWIWEKPEFLAGFGAVFLLTFICALGMHHRLGGEVADAF